MTEPIRVFIGTDHSQNVPTAVLRHSILSRTASPVEFHEFKDLQTGLEEHFYTGFSFYRWGIPLSCGFKGRALYLDADIVVLGDIRELWEHPLGEHSHLCRRRPRFRFRRFRVKRLGGAYASVMSMSAASASTGIFGRGVSAPRRILAFTSKSSGVCRGRRRRKAVATSRRRSMIWIISKRDERKLSTTPTYRFSRGRRPVIDTKPCLDRRCARRIRPEPWISRRSKRMSPPVTSSPDDRLVHAEFRRGLNRALDWQHLMIVIGPRSMIAGLVCTSSGRVAC